MDSLVALAGVAAVGEVIAARGTALNQHRGFQRESEARLLADRRQTYLQFLASVCDMFLEIDKIHRHLHEGLLSPVEAMAKLRDLSSRDSQAALDTLRFVASEGVATAAAVLWEHIRRRKEPRGSDASHSHYRAWRDACWQARRNMIDATRQDLKSDALNWQTAGIGSGPGPAGDDEQTQTGWNQ